MLSKRRTPKTSVRPTATRNSQAANDAASTMMALSVVTRLLWLATSWRVRCAASQSEHLISIRTLGSLEAGFDPVDRTYPVRRIHARGRVYPDVGDDRFVLGFVPAGIDAIGCSLDRLVAVIVHHHDRKAARGFKRQAFQCRDHGFRLLLAGRTARGLFVRCLDAEDALRCRIRSERRHAAVGFDVFGLDPVGQRCLSREVAVRTARTEDRSW